MAVRARKRGVLIGPDSGVFVGTTRRSSRIGHSRPLGYGIPPGFETGVFLLPTRRDLLKGNLGDACVLARAPA